MLPEIRILDIGKFSALVEIATYARESRNWKGRRSILAGRSYLRKILYMASVSAIRCNERLK